MCIQISPTIATELTFLDTDQTEISNSVISEVKPTHGIDLPTCKSMILPEIHALIVEFGQPQWTLCMNRASHNSNYHIHFQLVTRTLGE